MNAEQRRRSKRDDDEGHDSSRCIFSAAPACMRAGKVKLCVSLSPREPHCAARAANSKILLFMHAPLQSHIGLHTQAADVQADCAARAANSKHKRFVIIIITTNYYVKDIIILYY